MTLADDEFTQYYRDLLTGTYDCVDRLVINAYYPMGQSPGGFRVWWRNLFGSDDELDDNHLMRMAGRFGRRARGWAKANNVPVQFCAPGVRKCDLADEQFPKVPDFTGVFLIQVSKAPAAVWQVKRFGKGGIDIRRKDPWPYVNHYSFHIMDPDWGHITIRMSSHPPYGAMLLLNGHEWVERQATRQGLQITKQDNCFTACSDFDTLNKIAESLNSESFIGRLSSVCDHWIYSACLCFGLDLDDQKRTGFHYNYSVFQAEQSRNLIFKSGEQLDQVYQAMIDRTRSHFDIATLKTIYGWKNRPHHAAAKKRPEAKIEKPTYDLTVFKTRYDDQTDKVYDKGERVLRFEDVSHNVGKLRCGKVIEKLPVIITTLKQRLGRFMNVLRCADYSFLDAGTLDNLPLPVQVGSRRLAGIDINRPRARNVLSGVMALATRANGFSLADLAQTVRQIADLTEQQYTSRHAAYDITKLRGKALVQRLAKTRKYVVTAEGVSAIAALLTLREKVIKPILEGLRDIMPGPRPKDIAPIDLHYQRLRAEMRATFATLGIAV